MSSRNVVLRGNEPRVRQAPRVSRNDAGDAIFLSSAYGLEPDDWQEDALEDWLGRRSTERWSAATCGLAVARQNGKNGVLEVRELYGMVELGEKFLHTAHEVKTARKAFLRIASFFENEREYPELFALVKEIRKTNGQEAVVLTNGGAVEFIARSKGSGRGYTVDVLVCDEAQELTDEELAALLPTIAAAPLQNPQVILTGTPPDPKKAHLAKGEVFRRVRADGESGQDRHLAWMDFGVKDGPLPDVDDQALWQKCNPALGIRLNIAEVERERRLMDSEQFARERLGWWGDPNAATADVFEGHWPDCAIPPGEPPTTDLTLALAVTYDLSHASIAVSARWPDDRIHLGAHDRRRGTAWFVEVIRDIQERRNCPVIVDGRGPAAAFVPALEAVGVTVTIASSADVFDACGALYRDVLDGVVTHMNYADLDDAVAGAVRRDVGDRWAWGRKKSAFDVSMLEAATLAAWQTRQQTEAEPTAYVL